MPQLPFDTKHKTESLADFPKLRLEQNERARILLLEDPTFAYVHDLRAPKIVNGKAELKEIERSDKSTYIDFVKDFIGRPQCLGDIGILTDKGIDAKNCPACQVASESDEVDKPKRRFAVPVIAYSIKHGGFEVREPFGCEVLVWSFTDQTFNKLVDFATEWGDLKNHDLLLGPCENKQWQKFDIKVSKTAAWQLDDERKSLVVATYKGNKPSGDLENFCGRKVTRTWMLDDVAKIQKRWRIANGAPEDDGTQAVSSASLASGLQGLLEDTAPADGAPAGSAEPPLDTSDLLGTSSNVTVQSSPTGTAEQPKKDDQGAINFQDLLSGLG